MADFTIGDYEYTILSTGNTVSARVVDKTKSSYSNIPKTVIYNSVTYTVTSISACFFQCSSLVTAPTIPSSVTNMSFCFYYCTSLTEVSTIPTNVVDMDYCFCGCSALTGIIRVLNIPTSYDTIFYNTSQTINLMALEDGENRTIWKTIANNYSNVNVNTTMCITNDQDYSFTTFLSNNITAFDKSKSSYKPIPASVTLEGTTYTISGMFATFYNCTNLISCPSIPNNITDLANCFQNCTSLVTAPVIPNSVTSVSMCFEGCSSLVSAPVIPSSITAVARCFYNCTNLTGNIIVKNSTITNSTDCFTGTTHPIRICVDSSAVESAWQPIADEYNNVSIFSESEYFIIGDYKYYPINNTNYVRARVEDTTKTAYADLTDTVTYDGVTYTIVNLGNVNNEGCFYDCTNMVTAPRLPSTLRDTGTDYANYSMSGAFFGCASLKYVTIPEGPSNFKYCFTGCSDLEFVTLPSTAIDLQYCFTDCVSMVTSPRIPNSVTYINGCFLGCSNLTTVTNLPPSVNQNGLRETFNSCYSLTGENFPAFPTTVTNGDVLDLLGCFNDCTGLIVAPDLPNTNYLLDLTECFYGCSSLVNPPVIPESTVSMISCFYECTSLAAAPNIPKNVTDMNYCFYGCTSLTGDIHVYNDIQLTEEYNGQTWDINYDIFTDTVKLIRIVDHNEFSSNWESIANDFDNVTYVRISKNIMNFYNRDFQNSITIGTKYIGNNYPTNYFQIKNNVRFNKNLYLQPDAELSNILKDLEQ